MGKASPFARELAKCRQLLLRTEKQLEQVESSLMSGGVAAAYTAAFAYAAEAEQLLLQARLLPAYTGRGSYHTDRNRHLVAHVPIDVGVTEEGWFRVMIPALLPKKEKGSPDYIRDSLYAALLEYFRRNPRHKIRDATLVFRHHYSFDRPERHMRDHDNIELNAVVDALAMYVLVDDAPLLCNHYYCSIQAPEDGTEVLVLPRADLVKWLVNCENEGKNQV